MPDNHKKRSIPFAKSLMIATEFGFIIAIPLVIFASMGKWLANRYDNQLFIVGGLVLALTVTSIWLYYKTIRIYQELTKDIDT